LFKQMEYFEMPDLSALEEVDFLLDPAIRDTPSTREEIPMIGCPEMFICTVRSYQGCAFPRAQPLPWYRADHHTKTIVLFQYPVTLCRFKIARPDKVHEHCGRMHPTAFINPDDRRSKSVKLPQEVVAIHNYVNPEGAVPPECVKDTTAPPIGSTPPPANYCASGASAPGVHHRDCSPSS